MIAALIALYGIGMMQMFLLTHAAKRENVREWMLAVSIFFWPPVVLWCYTIVAIEILNEEMEGK